MKLTKRDGERFREHLRSITTMAVGSQNITFYLDSNNDKLHEWLDDIERDLTMARAILHGEGIR